MLYIFIYYALYITISKTINIIKTFKVTPLLYIGQLTATKKLKNLKKIILPI